MRNYYYPTLSQQGILSNEKMLPGSGINTIGFRLELPGYTDKDRIFSALSEILQSADVFSTDTTEIDGSVYILQNKSMPFYISSINCSSKEEAVSFCLQHENDKSLGTKSHKFYDFVIIEVENYGIIVSCIFNHLIIDGFGMCMVAQQLLDYLSGSKPGSSTFFSDDYLYSADKTPEALKPGNDSTLKDFWKDYFTGLTHEPSVFTVSSESFEKTDYNFEIEAELADRIKAFAKKCHVTEPAVYEAALAVYLSGCTNTESAGFIMPRLNRTLEDNSTIGCFTLVVPVKVDVPADSRFSKICSLVYSSAKMASSFKRFGIGDILKTLHNTTDYTDSFSEYTFNFYQPELHFNRPFEVSFSVCGAMHNHLTLNFLRKAGSVSITLNGRNGIYSPEKLEAFADSYITILKQGLQDKVVRDISLVSEAEKKEIFKLSKGNLYPLGKNESIVSLFRKAAAKYADRPALYAAGGEYNFSELDALSDRVAYGLISAGIKPGDRVLFMLSRDHRIIPVQLGILKAAAIFIPIDPAYPKDRVEYILTNSHAKLLISDSDVPGAAEHSFISAGQLMQTAEKKELPTIDCDMPAYCIYTSGTTGRPKGCLLKHRGIVNITNADNNPFNRDIVKTGKGLVAIGSVCFDISLFELFVPLLNGLFIEYAPDNAVTDPTALAALLQKHGANLLHCTPSRLNAYLNNFEFTRALKNVEAILSAGEVLPKALITTLRETYDVRIYNGYGPTETTIGATITEAGDDLSIGRPIGNMGVLVMNKNLALLPRGMNGELCIYGEGVGIEYIDMPELTAAKFVNSEGLRLYRTGDIGHVLSDGRIIYKGRNDNQVKLRGLRIELPEIENVMSQFKGITASVVMVRASEHSKFLAGFYTALCPIDNDRLSAFMKKRLPAYMVPDVFVALDAIPQTPGGKTDMKALASIEVVLKRSERRPVTEQEIALCQAFGRVLNDSSYGPDDNFFELGGDSITAIELITVLADTEFSAITYEDIFKYPSPALIIENILHSSAANDEDEINPLSELDYTGIDEQLKRTPTDAPSYPLSANILITGATGYLGAHILLDLLNNPEYTGNITCLVRPSSKLSAEKRILSTLFYYGEKAFDELLGNRLIILEGDLTSPESIEPAFAKHIDFVINAAANVAHFAYGDALNKVNREGVQNLIDACLKHNAALIQISTISVGGMYKRGSSPLTLTEKDFFLGQQISNQYILSKYMAEYDILRAAADQGLRFKIMRVGNLQGRMSDGEFQINMSSNAFARLMSSYVKLGKIPATLLKHSVNFSPVDDTAHMIVKLSFLCDDYQIFHVYPREEARFSHMFSILSEIGHPVEVVPDEVFASFLAEARNDDTLQDAAVKLELEHPDTTYTYTGITCDFTSSVLEKNGAKWHTITDDYLTNYFNALDGMLMFDNF
ncbi:MAG: amino acid adenylation domain-containing protein [Lachnospiraceae bacterium]|nr:amino acid adenylation domain-containing protein [Lachnospiraceae bacterium]